MAPLIDKNLETLRQNVARFADREVACRRDLHLIETFPWDIWRKMGRENLMGLGIPRKYGGLGEKSLAATVAGETFVAHGHNMGLGVSWLIHLIVARFLILGLGSSEQRKALLPEMASGRLTPSLAISEPGTGAHPKHIRTTATPHNGGYIINGEKAYLTNGPIAGIYVVVAVTGKEEDRRLFTAFIVPRDAPGLSPGEPMSFDFLRPSPHGGIIVENCFVPASAVLGKKDAAYDDVVKPFREIEDTIMMGPMVGAMSRQLKLAAAHLAKKPTHSQKKASQDLGHLRSLIHTIRIMAYHAAGMLETKREHPDFQALLLCARFLFKEAQSTLDRLISRPELESLKELAPLTHDVRRTMEIAGNVAGIKLGKFGAGLLHKGA